MTKQPWTPIYEGLSAKERAILHVRALRARQRPDRLIQATMPPEQLEEFRWLTASVGATNHCLRMIALPLREQSDKVRLQLTLLTTTYLWLDAVDLLREIGGGSAPLTSAMRQEIMDFVGRTPELPALPLSMAADDIQTEAAQCHTRKVARLVHGSLREVWRTLRSIEVVVSESMQQFDGESLLSPELHGALDAIRSDLLSVPGDLHMFLRDVELPEPDEEEVAMVRECVEARRREWLEA